MYQKFTKNKNSLDDMVLFAHINVMVNKRYKLLPENLEKQFCKILRDIKLTYSHCVVIISFWIKFFM